MTILEERSVEIGGALDDMDHFCCCEAEQRGYKLGEDTPSLCGVLSLMVPDVANEVACVVCNDLLQSGYCPLRADHKCPYDMEDPP